MCNTSKSHECFQQSQARPITSGDREHSCKTKEDQPTQNVELIRQQQAEAFDIIDNLVPIHKICSGGQTGADRAGLDAARVIGVETCGWCPQGGLAEDYATSPGILKDYPELKETSTNSYVVRTAYNVRDSHATLIVSPGGLQPKSGTEMTVRFAQAYGRPYKVVESIDEVEDVLSWILGLGRGLTLNIAGPRESKHEGTYRCTFEIVDSLLKSQDKRRKEIYE